MSYTRLKAKCLSCSLHFVVYTEHPDWHNLATLYCPECGQHAGEFLTWSDEDSGEIRNEVPGLAALTSDIDFDVASISIADLKP